MQHLDYKTHVAPSVNKVASCVGRAGGSMWTERSTCGRESNRWGCIRCGRVWVGNRGSLPTSFPPSLFPSGRVTFRPTSPRFRIFALGIEWTCLAFKCWPIAPYKTVSSSSNNSFKQPKTSTQTHPQTIKHKKQQHKSNKRAKTRKKTKENQRKHKTVTPRSSREAAEWDTPLGAVAREPYGVQPPRVGDWITHWNTLLGVDRMC